MKEGTALVEQVTSSGDIILGCDFSLSTSEIFDRLQKYFPNIEKDSDGFIHGNYKGFKYSIRAKNITYLGNPHPEFKKRIQISDDLPQFYQHSKSQGYVPLLIGIYTFHETQVFANFNITDYIEKKAHNSSAHVYTQDISAAVVDGIFQKTDYFNNTVTVFEKGFVNYFLDDYLNLEKEEIVSFNKETISNFTLEENDLAKNIGCIVKPTIMPMNTIYPVMKFFYEERKEWKGIDCYKDMIKENYRNKFQPEWAGFYLEYEFEKYIKNNKLETIVDFAQDKSKNGIDLDLFFSNIKCYGDLKAHSTNSSGIQGNDRATIIKQIQTNGHVFYVVCSHDTFKDSNYDFEVTKYWNTVQKKEDLLSYSKKMKNKVVLKKSFILDINGNNFSSLSIFKQGINSNGKLREPKIMISEEKIDEFIIAKMELVS